MSEDVTTEIVKLERSKPPLDTGNTLQTPVANLLNTVPIRVSQGILEPKTPKKTPTLKKGESITTQGGLTFRSDGNLVCQKKKGTNLWSTLDEEDPTQTNWYIFEGERFVSLNPLFRNLDGTGWFLSDDRKTLYDCNGIAIGPNKHGIYESENINFSLIESSSGGFKKA